MLMVLLNEYDYKERKRSYIENNLKGGENLFKHFTPEQVEFLMNYYEQYTVYLFYKIRKNLRLEVSKNKIKILSDLKGDGEWEFAGMRDTKGFGDVYCELGHPLRYAYKARNKTNGNTIIFGSTCVGDFFELDQKGINDLKKLKDTMQKELRTLIAVIKLNLQKEYLIYECKDFGRLASLFGTGCASYLPQSYVKDNIVKCNSLGLPIPATLVEEYRLKSVMSKGLEMFSLRNDMFAQFANTFTDCSSHFVIDAVKSLDRFFARAFQVRVPELPYIYGYSVAKYMRMFNIENIVKFPTVWKQRITAVKELEQLYIDNGLQVNFIDIYELRDKINKPIPEQYVECLHFLASFLNRDSEIPFSKGRSDKCGLLGIHNLNIYEKYILNFEHYIETYKQEQYIKAVVVMSKVLLKHVQDYYAKMQEDLIKKQEEEKARVSIEEEKRIVNEYLKTKITNENKYSIKGGKVAYGVIIEQKVPCERWSQAQWIWIKEAYNAFKAVEAKHDAHVAKTEEVNKGIEVNNKYKLGDKPDIKNKIDTILESPYYHNLDEKTRSIINTVNTFKNVSDRQIKYIEQAYLEVTKRR